MSRSRKSMLFGLLLIPVMAGGFVFQQRETQQGARLLDQVLNIVSSRFVDTVDAATLYEKAARGLVHELNDPYSVLLSPKELSSFNAQTNGRYAGIGMEIAETQGFISVQRVFPHTPAEQAGVQEGDRINFVDTTNTRGWTVSQTSDALKGNPGSKVLVKFSRPGVPELIPITFTRAVINIPAVPYAIMLDGKIGYIPLLQFNESARDELESAISRLSREGAHGIVIDLRGNPGGILDQSLSVSNLFLKKGQQISSIRSRNGENQLFPASDDPIAPTIPLVLLIDGRSASASEIVAGALQDRPCPHHRHDFVRKRARAIGVPARWRLRAQDDDGEVVHAERPLHPEGAQASSKRRLRRSHARFARDGFGSSLTSCFPLRCRSHRLWRRRDHSGHHRAARHTDDRGAEGVQRVRSEDGRCESYADGILA